MDIEVKVEGLEELSAKLERLAKEYPDSGGEALKEAAREFRKDVARRVRKGAKGKAGRKSLRRVGTYKILPIRGYGRDQAIDIGARAPHFHLYERGHDQTARDGKTVIGHVEGRYAMRDTIQEYKKNYPEIMEKMVDRIIRENGLT